jgi:hypothetical protein
MVLLRLVLQPNLHLQNALLLDRMRKVEHDEYLRDLASRR